MMFITHLSFSLFLGLIMIYYIPMPVNQTVFLIIILLAGLLPDIDSAHSFFGSKVKALSLAFRHRGVIHSILTMIIFSIVLLIITPSFYYLLAFIAGYLSHLLLDSLTPKGIPLLWPSKKRVNGRFKTTGWIDWLLLLFFLVADAIIIL